MTAKTKQTVYECFYPERGYDPKLPDARTATASLKSLEPGTEAIVDVMVYYVECGVKFTSDYGDIDEAYYTGMVNMFERAMNLVKADELENIFQDGAHEIVKDTENTGRGFHDDLLYLYHKYFESNK